MYIQLYDYMSNFLNQLLCIFRKAHSTQHALFKLICSWQKGLDESGFVGIKAYDCLPHDLIVAKLEDYEKPEKVSVSDTREKTSIEI